MLVKKGDNATVGQGVQAHVIWMAEEPMKLHKQYAVKFASKKALGNIVNIQHKIDVNTLATSDAEQLELNEIAVCDISFDMPVIFDNYKNNRTTGAFIIIDRITNGTVGAGMISDSLDISGLDTSISTDDLKKELAEKLSSISSQLDDMPEAKLIALYKAINGVDL